MFNTKVKTAIVYDWIDKWGGVERVLIHLHQLFPDAHFFTSAVKRQNAEWSNELTIHSSFLQRIPPFIRSNRACMAALYPIGFESFRFDEYELVISVTSAFAKGIVTKPDTKHICYLLTPPRYLWSHKGDYLSGIKNVLGGPLWRHLKRWDVLASHRPDGYISLSKETARRAKRYYGVASPVVYPPFDTAYWDRNKKEMKKPAFFPLPKPYYLWVGRMESYKRVDLVVAAARQKKDQTFLFVGTGTLESKLRKEAPPNCFFTGFIQEEELSYVYSHAQALLMPQNEDFGYVSLEAQYHGCPVIAFRAGGACETVKEGESGLFFDEQTVSSFLSQLERFEQISYNLSHSTMQVQKTMKDRFGIQRFDEQFVYQLNQFVSL